MSSKFFIADPHLDHENIRIHCHRPWMDCDSMNKGIVSNINSVVGRKDELYIVGDFAFRNHGRWINEINGKKFLIKGNHDRMNQNLFAGEDEDESGMDEKYMRCFSGVEQIMEIKVDKHRIVMCHFPMVSWNASCHGSWHLYGHVHGRYKHPGLAMDVGMDTNNYMPYTWEQIKKTMYDKIDAERQKNGLYMGWRQIDQGACVGIKKMTKDAVVCVVHRGYDNISSPYETRRLSDKDGGYFMFNGMKFYDKDMTWRIDTGAI